MKGTLVASALIAVLASALIAVFAAALLAVLAALIVVVAVVTVVVAAAAAVALSRRMAHKAFHEVNELWGRPASQRRTFSTLGGASRMLAAGVRQC
jgi:membrane protein implicated in regulation of membrane protease activity